MITSSFYFPTPAFYAPNTPPRFLIPELANYSPTEFAQSYLHKFMVFLSGMLKKDKDRNDAFLAIGNIANAVKSAIAPYLDGVLIYVREGLSLKS